MKKFLLFAASALSVTFFSCKHDSLIPEQQVSFKTDIVPIISSSCMHSGCHNDNDHPATNTFNTVANDTISYDLVIAGENIVAGKPHDSKIYNAITGSGEEFMPRDNYPPLNDIQIRKIYIWIAQGAKNN